MGPSRLERSVSPALPSSLVSVDSGSWGDLCLPRSEIRCWLWAPCLPWREPIEAILHHCVGKRCSLCSRCLVKLGKEAQLQRKRSLHEACAQSATLIESRNAFCGENAISFVAIIPGWLFAAGQLGASSIYLHIQARLHSIARLPCRFCCGHLPGGSHWNNCSHSGSQEAPHLCKCECHS